MEIYTWREDGNNFKFKNNVGPRTFLFSETELTYQGVRYSNDRQEYSYFTHRDNLNNEIGYCIKAKPGDNDALVAENFQLPKKISEIEQIITNAHEKSKNSRQITSEKRSKTTVVSLPKQPPPRIQADEMIAPDVGSSLSRQVPGNNEYKSGKIYFEKNDNQFVIAGFEANNVLIPQDVAGALYDKHQEIIKRDNGVLSVLKGPNDNDFVIDDSEYKDSKYPDLPKKGRSRKLKSISENELAQIHPTIRNDFKKWYDKAYSKSGEKGQALTFFTNAQAMYPNKSPYDYEEKDFKKVPDHKSRTKHSGAMFLKHNASKLTVEAFRKYLLEHFIDQETMNKMNERTDGVGEQRTREPDGPDALEEPAGKSSNSDDSLENVDLIGVSDNEPGNQASSSAIAAAQPLEAELRTNLRVTVQAPEMPGRSTQETARVSHSAVYPIFEEPEEISAIDEFPTLPKASIESLTQQDEKLLKRADADLRRRHRSEVQPPPELVPRSMEKPIPPAHATHGLTSILKHASSRTSAEVPASIKHDSEQAVSEAVLKQKLDTRTGLEAPPAKRVKSSNVENPETESSISNRSRVVADASFNDKERTWEELSTSERAKSVRSISGIPKPNDSSASRYWKKLGPVNRSR